MSLSAADLQVLIARLTGVADQMGAVLQRSAFSPNIKERADCSAAVFDASGRVLAQAAHIPVHLGSMPASVAAVVRAFDTGAGVADSALGPGEHAIVNDPFRGGTHLNDVTVVTPVWVDGVLRGWVANRAHHADLGGAAPGSLPADATDVAQEGLRIPPSRLTLDLRELVLANSRTPWERSGDLDAQVGANVVGAERLAPLLAQPTGEVLDHGERLARSAIARLPDGEWSAEDRMDSIGPGGPPARLCCTVRIDGEDMEFDFTGTDPQGWGNVNAVEAVTVSAVTYVLRSIVDHALPANEGALRPVNVVAPAGSIVAASFPAAVGAGNVEVSQRIVDVATLALAQVPGLAVPAASQGTMNNLLVGASGRDGTGAANSWVYYETIGGGQGGRPPRPDRLDGVPQPGMSGVHTHMTNTRNTPVEALERSYPLRVRSLRLRPGTGGTGAAPGGDGIERTVELLADAVVSLITERRSSGPWGLDGGGDGAVGRNEVLRARPDGSTGPAEVVGDKVTLRLRSGDIVRIGTPGGGGWGTGTPSDWSPVPLSAPSAPVPTWDGITPDDPEEHPGSWRS